MAALHVVQPNELLTQAAGDASPDLLRSLLRSTINMSLSADAHVVCGAEYRVPSGSSLHQSHPAERLGRDEKTEPPSNPGRFTTLGWSFVAPR